MHRSQLPAEWGSLRLVIAKHYFRTSEKRPCLPPKICEYFNFAIFLTTDNICEASVIACLVTRLLTPAFQLKERLISTTSFVRLCWDHSPPVLSSFETQNLPSNLFYCQFIRWLFPARDKRLQDALVVELNPYYHWIICWLNIYQLDCFTKSKSFTK